MPIDAWIQFAKGPLFVVTFLVMVFGLGRQVLLQFYFLWVKKGRRLTQAPWSRVARDAASWAIPVRHIEPGTGLFSVASYLMHVGLLAVPLFLVDHVALWEGVVGARLPAIGKGVADILTLLTIYCGLLLLALRLFRARHRLVSRVSDYVLLVLVLLPFVSGYLAAHPRANPLPWDVMMLTHLLSAELLFVLTPFTKLAHVVLFFFDRISAVHWQLRPGAGDRVAEALYGKELRAG
jgi:nitrate reductase gamma subunit